MTRALWYAFVAVLVVLAVGVELDSHSRHDADVVALVPAPFRNYAQEYVVRDALRLGEMNPDAAVAEARTLARRRPIPAESLFLLASAYQLAGQSQQSIRALSISASRGWRYPPVQQAMAGSALHAGALDVAASRIIALWSVDFDKGGRAALTRTLLATPGGPQAFGKLLADIRFAQNGILRAAAGLATPQAYARMVQAAIAAGGHLDCGLLAQQAATLSRRGHKNEARLLHDPKCV